MARRRGSVVAPPAIALVDTTLAKAGVDARLPSGWAARDEAPGFIDIVAPEKTMSLFLGCTRIKPNDPISSMLHRFTTGAPTRDEAGWTVADGTANDGALRTVVCMRDDGGLRTWVRLTAKPDAFANEPAPAGVLLDIARSLRGMKPSG
jgi:hypothetical protein